MILNGLKTSKDKTKFTDSEKLHYVKVPENQLRFDSKDENDNKSLHYIYSGDVTLLSRTLKYGKLVERRRDVLDTLVRESGISPLCKNDTVLYTDDNRTIKI